MHLYSLSECGCPYKVSHTTVQRRGNEVDRGGAYIRLNMLQLASSLYLPWVAPYNCEW